MGANAPQEGRAWEPAVSRKGRRLAYVIRLSDTNLWRADLEALPKPRPLTNGLGSSIAETTRRTPAARIASVQGGVRP